MQKNTIGTTDNWKLGCMFPLFGLAVQGCNDVKTITTMCQ